MKKRYLLLLLFSGLLIGTFSACGNNASDSSNASVTKDDNTLVVLNYGKYLEANVIKEFEKETGIKVKLEEYESPEEMYTKFSAGSINYDLICTSDYMVQRLIQEGKVLDIDFDSFQYYENFDPEIINAAKTFDPDSNYSMPYFIGNHCRII